MVTKSISFWKEIVINKNEINCENVSFYIYSLLQNFTKDLISFKIPTLVSYGTKVYKGIFNDYLNVLTIRNNKTNFTFNYYFGCDHNIFPTKDDKINYEKENWTKVSKDWLYWLERTNSLSSIYDFGKIYFLLYIFLVNPHNNNF